jgi:hypothetical protein
MADQPAGNIDASPLQDFTAWHDADPKAAEEWFHAQSNPGLRAALAPALLTESKTDWSVFPSSEDRMEYAQKVLFHDDYRDRDDDGDRTRDPVPRTPPEAIPDEWLHQVQLTGRRKNPSPMKCGPLPVRRTAAFFPQPP